jgi:glutathione transport system ATP-binding protein
LSLQLSRGETLALVGESGSGKSISSLALMNLLNLQQAEVSGQRWFKRRNGSVIDLSVLPAQQWSALRGADMSMIFQEPMTALNPVMTIGQQLIEPLRQHKQLSNKQAKQEALLWLERVKLADAKNLLDRYPFQLSGGMRQRVMIAMALCCEPTLLIADEPTTALDVTIQAEILNLIRELQTAVLFITHDLGVVAEMADRVSVLEHGIIRETATVEQIFNAPKHPYTQRLLASIPRLGDMQDKPWPTKFSLPEAAEAPPVTPSSPYQASPLLQVEDLVTCFPVRGGIFNRIIKQNVAVDNVSFELYPGETLAIVGESGSGKSTTGRSLLQLVASQSGRITLLGQRIDKLDKKQLNAARKDIQFIFQDPYASLDPRQTVGYAIIEPLLVHKLLPVQQAQERLYQLLDQVGLDSDSALRYPHEFSGGQRQRICIARALACEPKVVIADEAVSALDVSVQAQIINLMIDLQQQQGIAFNFISHDMAVVERISHRVAVMYQGRIVEIGPRASLFANPCHPYTQKLIAAVPTPLPQSPNKKLNRYFANNSAEFTQLNRSEGRPQFKAVGERHFVAL